MNKYVIAFFRRVVKDLKQKELLPLKLLFFMHSSTILVMYPYLTIHMRELGINVEETAIMSAVTPAVAILMPPIAGLIADKIGNFRVLLSAFSIVGGLSALLLLLVPVGRVTVTLPDRVVLGVSCEPYHQPVVTLFQDAPCQTVDPDGVFEAEMEIKNCGVACQAFVSEEYMREIQNARIFDVQMYDIKSNSTVSHSYSTGLGEPEPNVDQQIRSHQKKLEIDRAFLTSIRKLSLHSFYFPTLALYNFSCDTSNETDLPCILGSMENFIDFQRLSNPFKAGLKLQEIQHDDFEERRLVYQMEYVNSKKNNNLTCVESVKPKEHISVTIDLKKDENSTVKQLTLGSCSRRCIATAPRQKVCSNMKAAWEINMSVTFWSYLSVRVFVGIISGTSFAMFEGAVIALLREHKADYGLQRIYATIGGMISSPISGWMIDYASKGKGYTDFRPIFFLYAALKVVSGVLMLFINLEFKKAAASVITDVITVLKKVEMIALFTSCIMLGCAWGFIESFLFWLIDDLGGSKSLMGLTVTIGGSIGIPLLVLSGPIIKKLGHANVIFIGFVFYAIRLLGYSLLYNPWLCLIFEAMESITFGLSFTAAVTYAAKLSTTTTDTSIQGMLGGLYYGVGKGVGSLVGGYLIEPIGIRSTFQIFAGATLIVGFIYLAFYHFYLKYHPSQGTDITKKDVEKRPELDLKEKAEIAEIQADLPVVYEDAMCNPAYETTEVEDEEVEKQEPPNNIALKDNGRY